MSCDSTYQRRAHDDAIAGAARLAEHPAECICDCAVVARLNRADRDGKIKRQAQEKPPAMPGDPLSGQE